MVWQGPLARCLIEWSVYECAPCLRMRIPASFHRSRWNRATPAERRYLAALADLGDGPRPTADVSARLGLTQQQTAVQRQNLIDVKGLVYSPQRGLIDFTAPLFGDYVRRHHPLSDLLTTA